MKPIFSPFRPIAFTGLIAVALASTGRAQGAGQISDEDLLLARNPIVIKNRLRVANEYSDMGGGGSRDKLILGGVYGFGFNGHDRDYGVGFELPILSNDPPSGGSDIGTGDFKLRIGHLLREDPDSWRAGWFCETEFDTADDAVRAIANQRTQMAAGAGVSYPVLERLVLSSSLQYGWSLDDGETTGRKSEGEAHLTASAKVSARVSLNLDYKAVINTVSGTELLNTLEPSVGWTLGEKKDFGLFASWELPLDETGTNWVAKAGLAWFF